MFLILFSDTKVSQVINIVIILCCIVGFSFCLIVFFIVFKKYKMCSKCGAAFHNVSQDVNCDGGAYEMYRIYYNVDADDTSV